jgi:glutamate dehydrogenase (NAD(P)+)
VTVSYFEWVQDHQRYSWDELDVQERLRRQLRAAFARVVDASDRLGCDMRMAALSVAIERVSEAARMRGIYP